jgi:hypothetical protein
MIFAPDIKMDDKNKMLMKTCFTPIPSSVPNTEVPPEPTTVQVPPDMMSASISLPDTTPYTPPTDFGAAAALFDPNYKPDNFIAEVDPQHFSFEPSSTVEAVNEPWLSAPEQAPGFGFDAAQAQPGLPTADGQPGAPGFNAEVQSTSPAVLYNKLNEQIDGGQISNQAPAKRTGEIPAYTEFGEQAELKGERNTTANELPAVPENGELMPSPRVGKVETPPAGPLAEAFKTRKSRTNLSSAAEVDAVGTDQYKNLAEAISGMTSDEIGQPLIQPSFPETQPPVQAFDAFTPMPPLPAPPPPEPQPTFDYAQPVVPPPPPPPRRVEDRANNPALQTLIDPISPLNVEIVEPLYEPAAFEPPPPPLVLPAEAEPVVAKQNAFEMELPTAPQPAPEAAPVAPKLNTFEMELPPPPVATPEPAPAFVKFNTSETQLPPAPAVPEPIVPKRNTFSDLISPAVDAKADPAPTASEAAHVSQAAPATTDPLTPPPTTGTRRSVEFQEPKLVLNEMASLMSKLELQVSKASKRLASRAEEIEHRLNKQLEGLMDEAAQEDKDVEASMLVLCDTLGKEFEQSSESLRQKISNVASEGRQNVKQLLAKSQSDVDQRKDSIQQELETACSEFRADTERLIRESKGKLNKLLQDSMAEMADVLKTILDRLDDSTADQSDKLKDRFERFCERMSEETRAVLGTIERNVRSMGEEIDGSWQRASEKLRLSQSDFEQTILHAVRVAELALSQSARTLLVEQFFPKLKERKEIVTNMVAEMTNTFSEQSLNQARGQLMGLEASLASARQQLQALADECLNRIDSVGRDQQSVLEDLFKDTSGYIERSTSDVLAQLKKAEDQILESEAVCKRLAETFSLDADPVLSDERNAAMVSVQSLRGQLKKELESAGDLSCAKLDEVAQSAQSRLNAKRQMQIQVVREASEGGLNQIREAIQEAFNAIQASREKNME